MFSIAGMAEHPPANAAQPDAQPEDHNSQAGAACTIATIATIATITGDTTSNHESAPQPRAVTLSAPLAMLLAAQFTNAAEHMLLGKLQGRNQPSASELSTWCKENLHSTFLHITCLGLGYFEVAFSSRDGKDDTLRRCGFFLGEIEVVFSPWQPSFEPEDPTCVNALAYAIWVQFSGLNSLLRNKECLTEIGKHIGEVLMVEEDEINRAQTAGLRVRVLVSAEDLNALPTRIELPQIGNYGGKTCKANCILEDEPNIETDCRGDAHGKCGNKGLAASVNSQYTMTLSGPLSAPHSPPHFQQEAASRVASSCAGIAAMANKFSSRPVYDL